MENKNFRGSQLDKFHILRMYEDSDYSKFKMLPFNRPLDYRRISKMAIDINGDFDFRFEKPIDVIIRKYEGDDQEYYYLIDGQHRFEACKLINKSIFFIIHEKLNESHILKINENMKSIDIKSIINFHSKFTKSKPYQLLQDAVDFTKFKERTLLKLSNQSLTKSFLSAGNLKYTQKDVHTAKDIQKVFNLLKTKDKLVQERYFPIAIYKFHKIYGISFDQMIKRFRKNIEILNPKDVFSEGSAYAILVNDLWNRGLPMNSPDRIELVIDYKNGKIFIPKTNSKKAA